MSLALIRTEVVVGELPITTAQVTIITSAMVTGIFSRLGNWDKAPATKVTEIIGLMNKRAAKKIIHEDEMSISAADIFKCANCCANHSMSNTANNKRPISTEPAKKIISERCNGNLKNMSFLKRLIVNCTALNVFRLRWFTMPAQTYIHWVI